MIKAFYFSVILFSGLMCPIMLFAQVPNNSFENWTSGNPDSWYTSNIPIMPQSVLQDTDAYDAGSSVKGIVVSNIANQPFPPYLGYAGPSAGGFFIAQPYARVEGHCKLFLQSGDKFYGVAHVYNSLGEPIAEGTITIDTSISSWTTFAINITYTSLDITMRCAMFFTVTESSGLSSGHIGSYFLLDDLTMAGLTAVNINSTGENIRLNIYPNPASEKVHIRVNTKDGTALCTLVDCSGKKYMTLRLQNNEIDIPLNGLPRGDYFVNIYSDEYVTTRKLVVF